MFNTFRVAGMAAAAAFLCTGNSAAAQTADQVPAAKAAAATPVFPPVTNAPTVNAEPAVVTDLPAPADITADANLTPGRIRPDRAPTLVTAPQRAPDPDAAAGAPRSLDDLVADHARAETGDEQFECLARAVYFESRGEPLAGQLAVAEVIINRVRSGRFRDTICNVVTQPSQFSFVRRGVIPEAPRDSGAWHRAVAIAHIALNDLHDVTGEESLFFHATYVNPRWGRPRIARIGNHIFYR